MRRRLKSLLTFYIHQHHHRLHDHSLPRHHQQSHEIQEKKLTVKEQF
jgi:hypothetical protein